MTAVHDVSSIPREKPKLECDVVMKGGITSGVIYPKAVARLAAKYRLRSVGGTSAGAIAAAAAAAAELGRSSGAFERLQQMPTWLGSPAPGGSKGSNLRSLFQPNAGTAKTFGIGMAFVEHSRTKVGKALRGVWRAVRSYPISAIVGAAPGIIAAALSIRWGTGAAVWIGVACGAVLAIVGLVVAVAIKAVTSAMKALPENGHGLCSGLSESEDRGATPALTTWLADEIQALAGRAATDAPVTFADLLADGVDLQMLSTNITFGAPYRIPFDTGIFYYDTQEMRRLFPAHIVNHMVSVSQTMDNADDRLPYLPMPREELPVVVGARMSLSFPILLSAVPLWAVDYSSDGEPMCRQWFSDGGITSNFPVHFFDSPLPSRPTFAINLKRTESLDDDECNNVFLPSSNVSGILPDSAFVGSTTGFLKLIFDTMQNWADNGQTRMPAYRDRIVHVKHTDDEGGLNLDMPTERIEAMSERGECAAGVLNDLFDFDNHRWVRYRSFMALIEELMPRIQRAYVGEPEGAKTFAALTADPPSYKSGWSAPKQDFFLDRSGRLNLLAEQWPDETHSFGDGAPKPTPVLRVTPRV